MIDLGINDLFIEAGSYGYTLKQRKMVRDQKTNELKKTFVPVSYHGNLEATISAALNETIRQELSDYDGNVELNTALAELKVLHKQFTELLERTVGRYEKVGGSGNG